VRELSEKDKRVLIVGGICVGGIVALMLLTDWVGHWRQMRKSLAEKRDKFKSISVSEAKRAGLQSVVPVFEMPQAYEEQKYPFRDKFYEQLKEAGIKYESLQFLPLERSRRGNGYRLLRLQCRRGKCKFGPVLDLLARLNENPYLVGVEELKIECNPEKREEFELDLTVSTFVKEED
jgi:hypothetical protein